jgi:uncharacterized damage-inducible protein DinB
MNTFVVDYLERLDSLYDEVVNAIENIPQHALDWVPGPGMNSLAVLAIHVAGSSRYWIGDVAGESPSGRNRPAEFHATGVDLNTIKERLAASLAYAHEFMPTLSFEDLSSPRISPRDNRQVTIGWALAHALEHTALHTGHMQLTRQLWDISMTQS